MTHRRSGTASVRIETAGNPHARIAPTIGRDTRSRPKPGKQRDGLKPPARSGMGLRWLVMNRATLGEASIVTDSEMSDAVAAYYFRASQKAAPGKLPRLVGYAAVYDSRSAPTWGASSRPSGRGPSTARLPPAKTSSRRSITTGRRFWGAGRIPERSG